MKIRLELEVDLHTGAYDVRFHNLSHPGEDIDVGKLADITHRVLEQVHSQNQEDNRPTSPLSRSRARAN